MSAENFWTPGMYAVAVAIIAIVYWAGVARGKKIQKRKFDLARILQVAQTYQSLIDSGRSAPLHALTELGLHKLGNHESIETAIEQMEVLTGKDPWAGHRNVILGADLVEFFQYIHTHPVNLHDTPVEDVLLMVHHRDK
jgi:hypothetical protein